MQCEKCGRGYTVKNSYRKHVKICGIQFECEECNKSYATPNGLCRHKLAVHVSHRFICACGRAFSQRDNLARHRRLRCHLTRTEETDEQINTKDSDLETTQTNDSITMLVDRANKGTITAPSPQLITSTDAAISRTTTNPLLFINFSDMNRNLFNPLLPYCVVVNVDS